MKLDEINRRTKEAVAYLVESLESGRSEVLVQYLAAMGRFHHYSFGNVMLIARQRPDATHVAGFRTWNSLGRFVNKGQRGILILAPMVRRKRGEHESLPEEMVPPGRQLVGFRAAYVFDISQTDGKDLPVLTEVRGDVTDLRERLTAWLAEQAIAVSYSVDIAPARGVSSGGKITLLPSMPAAEEFATLVHEVAHELLHRGDRRLETSKQIRETEAEAVAFAVCESLGLETGSASVDYIELWHGDAQLLTASLEIVQRTSALILGALDPAEQRTPDDAGDQEPGPGPLCTNVSGG
jgi:N-terminal domain of anti-restriction factor ArdC